MQELTLDELMAVSGGDTVPASCSANGTSCSCPTGYYPATVNGQIVCARPH